MKKKVLVVDDSELVYQELRYHLGRCGRYEALVAVDVVMPGIDGIQAAKKLLAKHPEARVVIITSMVYTEIMEEAEAAGARGFLPKPFSPQQIIRTFDVACQLAPAVSGAAALAMPG